MEMNDDFLNLVFNILLSGSLNKHLNILIVVTALTLAEAATSDPTFTVDLSLFGLEA